MRALIQPGVILTELLNFCLYPAFEMHRFLVLLFLLYLVPLNASALLQPVPEEIKSTISVPNVNATSWLLVEFQTGWILAGENQTGRIEPASLTKLMTSYLVFDALKKQKIQLSDKVNISKKAWKTIGSRMFVQVDTQVRVEDLIRGLIIQSGNDASVALAEHLGGSEEQFAVMMNLMAAELGMMDTHFTNSSGLPDENHYSTVHDIVILARSLIKNFPDFYTYYSQQEYTYNDISQSNRNSLLYRDSTVDGIKTGYTRNAGYCLIGSANRNGTRFIAIVAGAKSKKRRADMVQSLLEYGYSAYEQRILYEPEAEIKVLPLWMGQVPQARVHAAESIGILYPTGTLDKLSAHLILPQSLEAPLAKGDRVGSLRIQYAGETVMEKALQVDEDYPAGPWFSQVWDWCKQLLLRPLALFLN